MKKTNTGTVDLINLLWSKITSIRPLRLGKPFVLVLETSNYSFWPAFPLHEYYNNRSFFRRSLVFSLHKFRSQWEIGLLWPSGKLFLPFSQDHSHMASSTSSSLSWRGTHYKIKGAVINQISRSKIIFFLQNAIPKLGFECFEDHL